MGKKKVDAENFYNKGLGESNKGTKKECEERKFVGLTVGWKIQRHKILH